MLIGFDTSRDVTEADFAEVDTLLRAAFGGEDEAVLVRRLRADGDMMVEVAKPAAGRRVAGYYALSRMTAPDGWMCLAPVAVWPDLQNGAAAPQGRDPAPWRIGSRMMAELADLAASPQSQLGTIVVLGDPAFYERAGFSRRRAARLESPYPVDYTMILRPGDDVPAARLVYPDAFGAAG